MTYEQIRQDPAIRTYISQADASLIALGFTEHSFAHVTMVAEKAGYILETLGYSARTVELARIAGYLHDIGNLVNRVEHSQSGAVMAFRILDEAEKNGQRVFIGLGNPYGYEGAASEMTELEKRYGGYRSFYGWYFAAEVVMSSTAPEEMIKWDYYGKLYRCAHALAPAKPVLISPMAIPCRKVLRHIKGRDVFDIIMPQDWVGGLGHTLRQSKRMHKKLAAFCAKNGKHLWANCESFNWKDTVLVPRYRGGGMVGKAGFDKQLKVARPFAEKLLSFALTGFWCPKDFVPKCGGDAAVKQFCDYVNYRNEIKKER